LKLLHTFLLCQELFLQGFHFTVKILVLVYLLLVLLLVPLEHEV
jgi:hypothetical protein